VISDRTRRGKAFVVLDMVEAGLAKLALDDMIEVIEARVNLPGYREIERLPEMLADTRQLRDRISRRLVRAGIRT